MKREEDLVQIVVIAPGTFRDERAALSMLVRQEECLTAALRLRQLNRGASIFVHYYDDVRYRDYEWRSFGDRRPRRRTAKAAA